MRKLKNRDKELSEIKAQVEQIERFVNTEYTYIDQEIKYYDNKMGKNPDDQNLIYFKEAVESYQQDVKDLSKRCG